MEDAISPDLRTSRPKRCEDVTSRLVDGEMVVLDRQHGFVHQLNKTATFIWEQCDGEHTTAEIASRMAEKFVVDEATALNDIIRVLNELRELKLLDNKNS